MESEEQRKGRKLPGDLLAECALTSNEERRILVLDKLRRFE